jgi:hypothetical protein
MISNKTVQMTDSQQRPQMTGDVAAEKCEKPKDFIMKRNFQPRRWKERNEDTKSCDGFGLESGNRLQMESPKRRRRTDLVSKKKNTKEEKIESGLQRKEKSV